MEVPVMLYIGGEVIISNEKVGCNTSPVRTIKISRSANLSGLLAKVHRKVNIDITKFRLKLSTKYSYMEFSRLVEVHMPIEDDDSLQFVLDNFDMQCIHLYIECHELTDENFNVDQHETSIPSITRGFNTINLSHHVGTSMSAHDVDDYQNYSHWEHDVGGWDHHITGSVEEHDDVWPGNVGGWNNWDSHLRNNMNFDVSLEANTSGLLRPISNEPVQPPRAPEMVIDSYGDVKETASEADNSSCELEDDECARDADASAFTVDPSSDPPHQNLGPSNAERDRTVTYDFPPFFSAVFDEQIPDSIGVSYGSRTRCYDRHRPDLCVNMIFKDKKELIHCVKDYSVRVVRREYRVVQSSPNFWKVCCKSSSSSVGCRWGLRACLKSNLGCWKITKYGGPHNCISSEVGLDHHNLDKNMVASILIGIVRCDPAYEIKYVKQLTKDRFGYEISYVKAWHSLKRAVENVYGTWESSVRQLPRYMGALVKHNPGTLVTWNHLQTMNPNVKILNYVFWAFRPCVDGFRHGRKVISVDGTHLYTKYKHKMLIAVTLDANNQVLPLAFAIVDEENNDSWKWFLQNLSTHVICGARGVCLISDRHRAILSAVEHVPDFRPPHGVHRFCLRHVCSNFNTQFKNVHLKDLCWQAGSQHQIRKFDAIMDAIKSKLPTAYTYLMHIPREKWTLAHDGGWRRGVMTTNMSECLNGVMKGARRLPISAIVQLTFQRCVQYYFDRVSRFENMIQSNQPWPDYVLHKYEKWSLQSSDHTVTRFEARDKTASVITCTRPDRQHVHTVSLSTNDCSCGKWNIFGIPCSHTICTAKWFGLDPASFVHKLLRMDEYTATYDGRFYPIGDEQYWEAPTFELHHNPTRRQRRKAGKDRTTRIRNEMDRPNVRERQRLDRESTS